MSDTNQPVQLHYGFRNLYYTAAKKNNVVACSKAEICSFNFQYYKREVFS